MPVRRPHVRAFLKDIKIALGTLLGRRVNEHQALDLLRDRPDLVQAFAQLQAEVPQADLTDDSLTQREHAPWREHFSRRLTGRGLEIGALHQPLPTHAGMSMTYVDRADFETLKRHTPDLAHKFTPVDIVDDAEELKTVGDASYDFVVAAHVFEHMRNPIGALRHWLRVVVPGGLVYLIVPDKRRTFDRPRVRTLLEHLIVDYQEPSTVRDFEHFVEYAVHVQRSWGLPALAEARRLEREDFSIHFHTFLPKDVVNIVRWMDENVTPVSIVEGPVMSPLGHEFHLLLKRGGAAEPPSP